eukprot:3112697-Alexandrium_andersonii.AAC.1
MRTCLRSNAPSLPFPGARTDRRQCGSWTRMALASERARCWAWEHVYQASFRSLALGGVQVASSPRSG